MPFVSRAQQRKLWATNPEVAKEFQAHTPKGAKLPEHVKKKSSISSKSNHVTSKLKRKGSK